MATKKETQQLSSVVSALDASLPALPLDATRPLVTAPGDAFTISASGSPANNTPAISEYTRTVGPDEHLTISGESLSGSSVKIWDGRLTYDTICKTQTTQLCVVQMPFIPKWGVYVAWGVNSTGAGLPAVINKATGWWTNEKLAAGMTGYFYGTNLAHDNIRGVNNAYIYIQPGAGGTVTQCTVTDVTPYCVSFTVPSVATGSYNIWCHNGHGGDYGWSERLSFTMVTAQEHVLTRSWGSTSPVNGTINNTSVDNKTAIDNVSFATQNAGGGNVSFLAGTYTIKTGLSARTNVRYLGAVDGAGLPTTIWKIDPTFTATDFALYGNFADSPMVCFENIKFDNSINRLTSSNGNTLFYFNSQTMLVFKNCIIDAGQLAPFYFRGAAPKNVYFIGCTIIGLSGEMNHIEGATYENCMIRFRNESDAGLFLKSPRYIRFVNNTILDDDSTVTDGTKTGVGRIVLMQQNEGAAWGGYYSGNTGLNLGPRNTGTNLPDKNKGENYLSEGNECQYQGSVTAATLTTVLLAGTAPNTTVIPSGNTIAYIYAGKGKGQFRKVATNNGTGTLTVDLPWRVIPDSTTKIAVGHYTIQQAIYENASTSKSYIPGDSNHYASCFASWYGGCMGNVVARNKQVGARKGSDEWCVQDANSFFEFSAWNLWVDNRWIGPRVGQRVVSYLTSPTNTIPGTTVLGTTYRRNNIKNSVLDGTFIEIPAQTQSIPYIDGVVFEHESGTDEVGAVNSFGGDTGSPQTNMLPGKMANTVNYKLNL